jgi:anti-sigma regulatory factor (Ser/Thr protein kinase)
MATSLYPRQARWRLMSFPSTLHLQPVLELLLQEIPDHGEAEVRLGLQEALVNAAKHGNALDPRCIVEVHYARCGGFHWWVIRDQGHGFQTPPPAELLCTQQLPEWEMDSGRGLFILQQVFDQVAWNEQGNELTLAKRISPPWSFWLNQFQQRLRPSWALP